MQRSGSSPRATVLGEAFAAGLSMTFVGKAPVCELSDGHLVSAK
jgi:hypothetical protein